MPLPKIVVPLLASLPANAWLVGTGIINWWKRERQTSRYGSVWLSRPVGHDASPMIIPNLGSPGQLIARLLEEGAFPLPDFYQTKRRPGQLVPLGEGRSFAADFGEPPLALGVKPTTGRKYNWLCSDSLWFLACCRVDLLWIPRAKQHELNPAGQGSR